MSVTAQLTAIPAGWVYKIKHRGDPIEELALQPKQFKARVVIRGQFMKEDLDFNDTLQCAYFWRLADVFWHGCQV